MVDGLHPAERYDAGEESYLAYVMRDGAGGGREAAALHPQLDAGIAGQCTDPHGGAHGPGLCPPHAFACGVAGQVRHEPGDSLSLGESGEGRQGGDQ